MGVVGASGFWGAETLFWNLLTENLYSTISIPTAQSIRYTSGGQRLFRLKPRELNLLSGLVERSSVRNVLNGSLLFIRGHG